MSGSGLVQDTANYQDTEKYQDMVDYPDAEKYQDTYTGDYQDVDKDQDIDYYQDTIKYQDTSKLLVGVVTARKFPRTIKAVTETWGRSASNLLFYSLFKRGGGKEEDDYETWAWHAGRRKGHLSNRVIRIKSGDLHASRTKQLLLVLRHMYTVLINQFDWFLYVPHNTYVRLDNVRSMLKDLDPNKTWLLGRPSRHGNDSEEAGSGILACDEERGVVMSRQLLWELGGVMEECEEEWSWKCLDQRTITEDCHTTQVREGGVTTWCLQLIL